MSESWFEPSGSKNFFRKDDPDDPRLGNFVQQRDLEISERRLNSGTKPKSLALIGYPDDEGIKLNGGRPGAALGPDSVRQFLYKMTPGLESPPPALYDFGNLVIKNFKLAERHAHAQQAVAKLLKSDYSIISVGGGHDYGFPDFSAFCEHTLAEGHRPFIINFDAHLDVRPDTESAHSGTAFHKLLKSFSGKIDFFEVGIQDWCNSKTHLQWLIEHGGQSISFNQILIHGRGLEGIVEEKVLSRFEKKNRLAVSICLDAFSSAFSPGSSQGFPVGLEPREFLKIWRKLVLHHGPRLTGFYETSPPYDLDGRTAKLCAILMHQYICGSST